MVTKCFNQLMAVVMGSAFVATVMTSVFIAVVMMSF